MAACTMASGVGKSGSPAPKPMTGSPAALRALALASTASVAEGVMAATRVAIRPPPAVAVEGDVMASTLPAPTTRAVRYFARHSSLEFVRRRAGSKELAGGASARHTGHP